MPGESLKQPSQQNQMTNDLLAELALPSHPASSFMKNLVFFHYNNLIHAFALCSARNSNQIFFGYFNKHALGYSV